MTETKRTFTLRRDERGVAFVIALLTMTLLFILGVAFLNYSSTESAIASNEVSTARAFYITEAGIHHAQKALEDLNLSEVLDGTTNIFPGGDTVNLGSGTYTVQVSNNFGAGFPLGTVPADSASGGCTPSATVDCDQIIVVRSTGSFQSNQRAVETIMQISNLATLDGSLQVITPDEVEVELEKGAVIDGRDWDPPADPSTCVDIATCGTLTGNPNIAGFSTNSSDFGVDVDASSAIYGTPETKINTSLSATPWNDLVDSLIPQADRNLSIAEQLTGTHTWGTPSAPEITVISGRDIEIESGAVVNGAGVLIVDIQGELELDHGTLNWQGLIIIRGDGELDVEFEDDNDATARIFGGFVVLPIGEDASFELEIENSRTFIKFSRSAIDLAESIALPTTVLSWREVL